MKGLTVVASLLVMTEADLAAEEARILLAQEIEQTSETLMVQGGKYEAIDSKLHRGRGL